MAVDPVRKIEELKEEEQRLIEAPGFSQGDANRQQEINEKISQIEQETGVDASKIQAGSQEVIEGGTDSGGSVEVRRDEVSIPGESGSQEIVVTGTSDTQQDKSQVEKVQEAAENQGYDDYSEKIQDFQDKTDTATFRPSDKGGVYLSGIDNPENTQKNERESKQSQQKPDSAGTTLTQEEIERTLGTGQPLPTTMTAPGAGLNTNQGPQLPNVGQQEFASGTQNVNYNYRQYLTPDVKAPESNQNQNPAQFGADVANTTSGLLTDAGLDKSQSQFLGTQLGTLAAFGAGTIQGISNIDEAAISLVNRPEKSVNKALQSFEEDVSGQSASELTDAEVNQAIASVGNKGVSANTIDRKLGDLQVLATVAGGFSGSLTASNKLDNFALRSPLKEVDNPTPEFEKAVTADNKLRSQLPFQKNTEGPKYISKVNTRNPFVVKENNAPDIPGTTSLDKRLGLRNPFTKSKMRIEPVPGTTRRTGGGNRFQTLESKSSTEAMEKLNEEVSTDNLPFLGETDFNKNTEAQIIQSFDVDTEQKRLENRRDINQEATKIRETRTASKTTVEQGQEFIPEDDRTAPIDEPEEGLTQNEMEVLTGSSVGFDDVRPRKETSTGGFESAQVDGRQIIADASQLDDTVITGKVDRLVEEFIDADQLGSGPGALVPDQEKVPDPDSIADNADPELSRPKPNPEAGDNIDSRNLFDDVSDQNRRDRNHFDAPESNNNLIEDNNLGLGLAIGSAISQQQNNAEIPGLQQRQGPAQFQDQDQEFEQEVQQVFRDPEGGGDSNGGSSIFGNDDEGWFRRDRDFTRNRRRRRGRDFDIDTESELIGLDAASGQQSASQGFMFTPTLESSLFGQTETVTEEELENINQQAFTGLEDRDILVVDETADKTEKNIEDAFGI